MAAAPEEPGCKGIHVQQRVIAHRQPCMTQQRLITRLPYSTQMMQVAVLRAWHAACRGVIAVAVPATVDKNGMTPRWYEGHTSTHETHTSWIVHGDGFVAVALAIAHIVKACGSGELQQQSQN